MFYTESPFDEEERKHDLSTTTFVDDLLKLAHVSSGTAEEAIEIQEEVNESLDECMAEEGFAQNKEKQEVENVEAYRTKEIARNWSNGGMAQSSQDSTK